MANIREGTGLSYDDVLLVPKLGRVNSRKDVVLTCSLTRGVAGEVPIISAPMSSVTNGKMAHAMWKSRAFGIIHRFMSPVEQAREFKSNMAYDDIGENNFYAGVALGIDEELTRFLKLVDAGCRIFCIDVAHAHSFKVGKFIERINQRPALRKDIHIIAGNVATGEGAEFLAELGVDAIKVGIGPGAACTTREVTGFGVPQLTAVLEAVEVGQSYGIPIIADGGIKSSGDIVKALAAGADTVMLGKLLAGANEAPAPGEYYGMASAKANAELTETKIDININREGVAGIVPVEGPLSDIINNLTAGIRSGVSYAGATNLYELRDSAEFIVVAPGVAVETGVRI